MSRASRDIRRAIFEAWMMGFLVDADEERGKMTQAEEHEALVEACAECLASLHDAEWNYIRSIAGHPLVASLRADVLAVLAVVTEKAKREWPTEGMAEAWHDARARNGHITVETGCAALIAASPLPKPGQDPK